MKEASSVAAPAASTRSVREEWLAGWPVVLVGVVGVGVSSSRYYSVGLFMKPLQEAFDWTRGQISAALMIYSLIGVAMAPFYGRMIDRLGARPVALLGVPLAALAFGCLSLVGPGLWTWFLVWFCLALVVDASSPLVWMTATSKRFDRHRGLAIAVVMSGAGIMSAAMPPLGLMLIESFGWRGAYAVLGLAFCATLLPMTLVFFHERQHGPRVAEPPTTFGGASLGEAMRNWRLWVIGVTMMVTAAAVGTSLVHLMPALTDAGLSEAHAAAAMALMGPSVVVGRLGTGYLLDRLHAPLVASAASSIPILGCLLLINIGDAAWTAPLIAIIFGVTTGAESDIVAYLTSRYFGRKNFGSIFGVLYGFFTLGVGVAPTAAGFIYDSTGSYRVMLIALICVLVCPAIMILRLGPYPHFSDSAPGGPSAVQ